jgi:hypothetical protein
VFGGDGGDIKRLTICKKKGPCGPSVFLDVSQSSKVFFALS